MALDIAVHGDVLEKKFANLIKTQLPYYEEVWKRFIGNDGTAHAIEIPKINEKESQDRTIFSQCSYSVLESVVCIQLLIQELHGISLPHKSVEDYLKINTLFLAFQAHAGRIRDCMKRMGEKMLLPNLYRKVDEYYKQRNNVLHGCKVPFAIKGGIFEIPDIEGSEEGVGKWNDKLTWNDAKNLKHIPLLEYLDETFRGLISNVNSCYAELLKPVNEIIKKHEIDYCHFEERIITKSKESIGVSGYSSEFIENHVFVFSGCDTSGCNSYLL